jgi:F-type H+-transporting ATPase subunit gamma
MESCVAENSHSRLMLVTIGHKLHTTLETDSRVIAEIDGANVAEEIEQVLARITETLLSLQTAYPTLSLFVLYHGGDQPNQPGGDDQQVLMQKLLSPFQRYLGKSPDFSHAPILNVAPADFLLELTDHYLFATLHEILYTSLMAENHRRVQHLDGAVQHLDDKENELSSQCNALRQEEIIEEIEVILLSAESLM